MGEMLEPVIPSFNRLLRVESRAGRLTGDPGAVLLREVRCLSKQLSHDFAFGRAFGWPGIGQTCPAAFVQFGAGPLSDAYRRRLQLADGGNP
jgi:hypothetical protein